jgi:hypothetical protein
MEPDLVSLKTPASSDSQTPRFHAPQDRERPPGSQTTIRAESILNAVNLPCELANIRLTTKRAVGMRQRARFKPCFDTSLTTPSAASIRVTADRPGSQIGAPDANLRRGLESWV